jgi:2-methylcitrate dehydratase
MDNIAEYMAHYGSSIAYENFSPETVYKMKGLLIDALACGIGGYDSEPGKITRSIAERVRPGEMSATILGSGRKSTPDLVAFANGSMIRYLDYNDGYVSNKGGGHPSDNFAPVLACAEAVHADGRRVIAASILAYEVCCQLQDQIDLTPQGFDQASIGVISCVIGASKILGLSPGQMFQAINLAITPNIALNQTRRGEISMWKGCAVANAARNAVFAALLAKEGMTGPNPVFEGRSGFIKAVSGPFELEEFGGNGKPFRIMAVSIKRYSCGKHGQTAVDAAIKLRSKISGVDEIAEINIGTCAHGKYSMASDAEKWHPMNRETADHSIPYVVGVAFMYGGVEVKHFADDYRHNPSLLDLIGKIKVEETEECNNLYPDASANRVEIITKSGKKFSELVQYHRGHFQNPLTDKEIEEKFHSLTGDFLKPKQRKRLLSLLWNLEQAEDVGKIMKLLKI